jgi:RecA/RadA recombinase
MNAVESLETVSDTTNSIGEEEYTDRRKVRICQEKCSAKLNALQFEAYQIQRGSSVQPQVFSP